MKLLVRQGGGAADEVDLVNLDDRPREAAPIFDGDTPLITMGHRWEQGTASRGQFSFSDPRALLPYVFRPHASVKLVEDATTPDTILAWGRIEGGNDTQRRTPTGIGGDAVEHAGIQTMDANLDLRGLPLGTEWVRPAEDSWDRLQALHDLKLAGSSSTGGLHRSTTNITVDRFTNGHLVDATDPVDLDPKTYPVGTQVEEILQDIFEQWGKGWGVTLHHDGGSHKCLLVQDLDDLTKFTSALRISDQIADWDPEDLTAPVLEPIWRAGAGKRVDNSDTISGLISIYGGLEDEPRHLFVETGEAPEDWEVWVDVYNDDLAENATQAERRANNVLNDRKRPYVTNQVSILLLPEQTPLIVAGQAIDVKSVVINQGPDKHEWVARRIAEILWEPNYDGRWWAHLELDRPRNSRPRRGGGQPGSTSPKPAPKPVPDIPGTAIALWTWDTDNLDTIGGTAHALRRAEAGWWPPAIAAWGDEMYGRNSAGSYLSQGIPVTGGNDYTFSMDILWQYNATWRGVWIKWLPGGETTDWIPEPTSGYATNTVYHKTTTATAPVGATSVQVRFKNFAGIYVNDLQIATVGTVTEDDPDAIEDSGDSPYYARSDDPRFSADDQHVTTRVSRVMTNDSGGDLVAGDVVIATGPDTVDTTTDAPFVDSMVGFLLEDIADGEEGVVVWESVGTVVPNLTGTTAPGEFLFPSGVAGTVSGDAARAEGALGVVIAVDDDDLPTFVEWWGVPDTAGGGSSGHTIKENGTPLTARAGLNFGSGIIAADDSGNNETDVDLDWAEDADVSTQAFGDAAATGTSQEVARAGHKHGMMADPVTAHVAASDPHGGYVLESLFAAKGDLIGASANDTPSLIAAGSEGQLPVTRSAATPGVAFEYQYASLQFIIGDGVNAISTGVKGYVRIPYACTIVRASLLADVSGAIKVDLWKDTYTNYPPTDADTITGGNEPEIAASGTKDEDTTLTSWTGTALAEGDILGVNVDSATTVKRVTLELRLRRS